MNKKIEITLPDQTCEVEIGTTPLEIIKSGQKPGDPLAAIINGEPARLSKPLYENSEVTPINRINRIGYSIYARSITYLFIIAVHEVLEEAQVIINHAINEEIRGEINSDQELTENKINQIKERMTKIVNNDNQIEKIKVRKERAEEIFKSYGAEDKIKLLENAVNYKYIKLYKCRGYYDYLYGPMVPSTGYLKEFEVKFLDEGFALLLPDKTELNQITKFKELPKLRAAYRETKDWAKILNIFNLGSINQQARNGQIKDTILVSEALHEKKISQIADTIDQKSNEVKIILIAGPTSSGKTTFSKRLSIQLRALGLEPHTIEADNYFVNRENTPLDEDGEYNFETIKALNVELLNKHLSKLLNGEEIKEVKFNFITGKRELTGEKYQMNDNSVLIVEGIHALNEAMTPLIDPEHKYKIYVSALTQLNIDNHNSLYVSDVRTIRRIIRDHRTRGRDAETTLLSWPSVRKGEDKNVFPYQEEADIMFNSTIVYEMNILKKYVKPLLEDIASDSPVFAEANRLLKTLKFFKPITDKYIPKNSIIKEFIGGSCFEN
ncbi:MAG: nucleoside kinase [Bacillota bacterium]